jgi:type IV secretory pathway VirB4 component
MASGAVKKDKEVQIAINLNCAGPQIIYIYDQFIWDEDGDEKKPNKLFEKLEGYCNPRKNEVLKSHRFWNVQYQQPFDNFLTELRTRASSCNFDNKDRMIRENIVFTVQGKLQDLLLCEDKLSLDKAIQLYRPYA